MKVQMQSWHFKVNVVHCNQIKGGLVMGSFIFLGIIILLSLPSLIRVAGVWSICLIVGAGCVGGGLCAGNSDCALFGLVLCLFGFLMVCARCMKTPQGRQNIAKRTKAQKKYEEEYGIIDFTEKDK